MRMLYLHGTALACPSGLSPGLPGTLGGQNRVGPPPWAVDAPVYGSHPQKGRGGWARWTYGEALCWLQLCFWSSALKACVLYLSLQVDMRTATV